MVRPVMSYFARLISAPLQRLATHLENRLPPTLRAIGWLILSGLLFMGFVTIVRALSSDLPVIEVTFIRYACGLVIFLPIFARGKFRVLRTKRLRDLGLRGTIHAIGVLLWFVAIARIPLSDVTALSFTSPIFVTLGAAVFLGERLRLRRIAALIVGFVGVLVILRPGLIEIELGAIAMLVAAPMFAASKLYTKSLARTESGPTIVAYLTIFATVITGIPAIFVWQTPDIWEVFWLLIAAGLATVSHLALIRGLRLAELSLLQPFEFLNLVWATAIGIFLFAEQPSLWVWIGGAIVIASASYIAHREAQLARRNK
jgi:drug/metabolite transporter (DMT)-like permease